SAKFIAFAIPNSEEPPQWVADDDGVIEFVRPLRVPLPNANPETWTEANCAPAFDAIAQWWKEDVISPYPIFLDIVLTSSKFFQWVDACDHKRPTFWSRPPGVTEAEKLPSFGTSGTRPAPDEETTKKLATKLASKERIKEAIDTIYSVAEKSGVKPPNIKELPPQVRNYLASSGYTASARQIQDLGSLQEFKLRRRPPGKTLKSERRGGWGKFCHMF